MSSENPKNEEWYRSRIDHLMARQEALDLALIQINVSLIQLCANLVENTRPNEAQLLLSLMPLIAKEEKENPKINAQLQRIAETLGEKEKEKEKKSDGR